MPLFVDQLKKHPNLRELQRLRPYLVDGIFQFGGRLHNIRLTTYDCKTSNFIAQYPSSDGSFNSWLSRERRSYGRYIYS